MLVNNPSMIRTSNRITKFDMVADRKLNCLVKRLFPIRKMKDILDNACGMGILGMVLLSFEMFKFDRSFYFKYSYVIRLRFG